MFAFDNFYHAPKALSIVAKGLNYGEQEHAGHKYTGIGLGFEPEGLWPLIRGVVGSIAPGISYFRLGTKEEKPTTYIHADGSCGTHAAVLYLSEPPDGVIAGTAFWKHKETGLTSAPTEAWIRANIGDSDKAVREFIEKLNADGNDESKWQMTDLIGQKFNRIAIYNGNIFHSRYPQAAWGSGVNDGRLVWTGFFNL